MRAQRYDFFVNYQNFFVLLRQKFNYLYESSKEIGRYYGYYVGSNTLNGLFSAPFLILQSTVDNTDDNDFFGASHSCVVAEARESLLANKNGKAFLAFPPMLVKQKSYFKILYSSDVKEIRMLVAENHSVVMLPTLEFCAFTLLGVTYTTSFCCR